MIRENPVPEANKRILLDFCCYLAEQEEQEHLIDSQMNDVSLYVMDYTSECLNGSCLPDINAFDVYCFLADYVIRQVPDCTPDNVLRILGSLARFVIYLAHAGLIEHVDLYEILSLCKDPNPYLLRCEEYRHLVRANDAAGLQRWRASVLDYFGI